MVLIGRCLVIMVSLFDSLWIVGVLRCGRVGRIKVEVIFNFICGIFLIIYYKK